MTEDLDPAVQERLERWNQRQEQITAWIRRRNWKLIIGILLFFTIVISLRAGWEYQARHNVDRQCAALHLLQEADGRLDTTDVAASSRFQILDADRALQQLYAEGFLRSTPGEGDYPGYFINVSRQNITQKCQNVEYRDDLRDRKHWRIQ